MKKYYYYHDFDKKYLNYNNEDFKDIKNDLIEFFTSPQPLEGLLEDAAQYAWNENEGFRGVDEARFLIFKDEIYVGQGEIYVEYEPSFYSHKVRTAKGKRI